MFEPDRIIESMFDLGMVTELRTALSGPVTEISDPERIDLIRSMEELKCAAEAAQAVLTRDFDASQRAEQAAAGVRAERQGVGVAAQVGLARRESPHKGQQHLQLARILPTEMPHTMAAWRAGRITQWRAQLLARETACLTLADRKTVDAEMAGDPEKLEGMGDGEIVTAARELAYRLDAESFVERRRRAESDRRVTLRPAPDVMAQLSALLPVKDGVAVHATLTKHADRRVAAGDQRSRGQIMADTLVERITGTRATTAADGHSGTDSAASTDAETDAADVSVTINVTVSDRVLLGIEGGAGWVEGYGPIPGDLAREMAADADWLRALYVTPETGDLVTMDSKADRFPTGLADFLRLRDRTCRNLWCDAPVRHADHVTGLAEGGPTSGANGQGLCEACNYAKAAPGWEARPRPGPRHTVQTTTPTGHTYTSTAPPADRDTREAPGAARMGWKINRLTLAS
jgi:hypothetical protein